jgi:hypothetical protein
MKVLTTPTTLKEIRETAAATFGDMVKAVVDLDRKIMVIGGELHADEEAELLRSGSKQINLWGINLYPDLDKKDWIGYDSMINVRPLTGNRSRVVEDEQIRANIQALVNQLVVR